MGTGGAYAKFLPSICLTSKHQNKIGEDESTHGAMFAPIVLGSDKMTVSVATGHTEFYPLYGSLGPVHNSVR